MRWSEILTPIESTPSLQDRNAILIKDLKHDLTSDRAVPTDCHTCRQVAYKLSLRLPESPIKSIITIDQEATERS